MESNPFTLDNFSNFSFNYDLLFQIFLLGLLFLYTAYSGLLYKQLTSLNHIIATPKGYLLNLVGFLNFILAISVFALSLFLLLF